MGRLLRRNSLKAGRKRPQAMQPLSDIHFDIRPISTWIQRPDAVVAGETIFFDVADADDGGYQRRNSSQQKNKPGFIDILPDPALQPAAEINRACIGQRQYRPLEIDKRPDLS